MNLIERLRDPRIQHKQLMLVAADRIEELEKQRDELLALLHEIYRDARMSESDLDKYQGYVEIDRAFVKKIRKAIARVKGEAA